MITITQLVSQAELEPLRSRAIDPRQDENLFCELRPILEPKVCCGAKVLVLAWATFESVLHLMLDILLDIPGLSTAPTSTMLIWICRFKVSTVLAARQVQSVRAY